MNDTIADRIKAIRLAAGDTSAAVGKRVGVSRQAVDKWERGDTENMKLGNLLRFCDSYHVNVEALIRGEGICGRSATKALQTLQALFAPLSQPSANITSPRMSYG